MPGDKPSFLFSAADRVIHLALVLLDSIWSQEAEELGLNEQSYGQPICASSTVSIAAERRLN